MIQPIASMFTGGKLAQVCQTAQGQRANRAVDLLGSGPPDSLAVLALRIPHIGPTSLFQMSQHIISSMKSGQTVIVAVPVSYSGHATVSPQRSVSQRGLPYVPVG